MPDPTKPGMLCPTCRTDLLMTDRQGVEIDYCPSCRGVWLDRGELDKLIERSAAYEAAPPPRQTGYGQHGGHHQHGKPHRRKSMLEQILDF